MKLKLALLLLILSGNGCNSFKEGPGGMWYQIVDDHRGRTIQPYEFAELACTIKTAAGAVVRAPAVPGQPMLVVRERSVFSGDFFAALGLLSEGDSAVIRIAADSLTKYHRWPGPKAKKDKYLVYEIRVNKVLARAGLNDSLYAARVAAYQKQTESGRIARYLAAQKLHPTVTSSGLRYRVDQQGPGRGAGTADTALVDYTATYLDGEVLETTHADMAKRAGIYDPDHIYRPVRQIVSNKVPVSGVTEALRLFPAGTRVTLVLPSRLAYGSTGYGPVLPYTPLVCSLEIINIRRKRP